MVMLIHHKLSSSVSLDIFGNQANALIGGKKFTTLNLPQGHLSPVYIAPLADDKIPKNISCGQYLSGTISYVKDEQGKKVDTYSFKYTITDSPKKQKNNGNSGKDKEKDKNKEEEFAEAVRDLKISWITKLDNGCSLYEELKRDHDDHLPLHVAKLHALDGDKERLKKLQDIIVAARHVISLVDQTALLTYFGMKSDPRPEAQTIKSEMDKQKTILVDAYIRLGCAQADTLLEQEPSVGENQNQVADSTTADVKLEDLDATWAEILKWSDTADSKVSMLTVRHALAHKHYGRALKVVTKQGEEKPAKDIDQKLLEIFGKLGWEHCVRHFENWLPVKYPAGYRPF
jgi:tripeptidyl-peptidase-2